MARPTVEDFPPKKILLHHRQAGQRVRSRRLATGDLLGIPKWLGGQEDSTQALGFCQISTGDLFDRISWFGNINDAATELSLSHLSHSGVPLAQDVSSHQLV